MCPVSSGDKFKNINHRIKNNLSNKKMNNCFKIRSNFNYDKLNELCHKINFDVFNNKNKYNL